MNFVDAVCKVKGDKVYLQAGPSAIELPPAKAKKLIEGGYDGKTVVLGIRPEDVHDEQMFIEASPNTVIEATIRVYEMLGAEVYLYFDYEGTSMTARVNPRTTARTGDTVKFALDAEKIHVFDKETEKTITTSENEVLGQGGNPCPFCAIRSDYGKESNSEKSYQGLSPDGVFTDAVRTLFRNGRIICRTGSGRYRTCSS